MDLDSYLDAIPPARRARFDAIRALIAELYPEASESMRYKMPTYEYEQGWIALANQKSYISVYTCSAEHIAAFRQRHPALKTGTGCINFRDRDDIPLDDLKAVISSALESRH